MNTFNSTLIIIFGIVAYLIIVDKNVADYLTLLFKMMKINADRTYWMIRLHPKNPITNLMMRIEYDRIAKELHRELIKNDDISNSN
jgi:hypothetical protein